MTALSINMTADDLKAAILAKFPANATCWSQATDEVRDMSRWAREEIGLDEDAATNFRAIRTPDRWNAVGAESAARFFAQMSARQRLNYLARIEGFLV
ncbi:hypothetical protein [Bosea sp. FBZP-16]|uniref:hypothetical protein n=1 Tax=Bosea sp. FBZP-16 TaxID=2065382 RepID=UPI000C30C4BD|nr:hypothetical protein [Bosea sp. FBZP-16]